MVHLWDPDRRWREWCAFSSGVILATATLAGQFTGEMDQPANAVAALGLKVGDNPKPARSRSPTSSCE